MYARIVWIDKMWLAEFDKRIRGQADLVGMSVCICVFDCVFRHAVDFAPPHGDYKPSTHEAANIYHFRVGINWELVLI